MKPVSLLFYAMNDKFQPEPILFDDKDKVAALKFNIWNNLIALISPLAGSMKITPFYPQKLDEQPPFEHRIIVLFLKMKHMADPSTYYNLVSSNSPHALRPIVEQKNWQPNDSAHLVPLPKLYYHPVITIGYEDVMELYTEKDGYELAEDMPHLEKLRLDSRFKFFDSSIWHRYIPVYPRKNREKGFRELFEKTISQIHTWHQEERYATNSARANLEFQLRMMKNSYIAKIGRTGHYEVVTPFKFHSESYMEEKIERHEKYLCGLQELSKKNKTPNKLQWQLLLIDDYAEKPISSYNDSCKLSKKDLIEQIISSKSYRVKIESPGKDNEVIDSCVEKMKSQVYDVLLLDYLLGSAQKKRKRREYGHDLMARLRNEHKSSAAALKIGPLGKYWICPISSFPYALKDKLWQLGIHAYDDLWRLSDGGDPICTPALFKYNLLSLFKRQVEESYFSVEELMHWCKRLDDIDDHERWAKIALRELKINKLRQESLERDEKDGSVFATSMQQIIPLAYKDFMEDISDLLTEFEKWNIKKDSRNKLEKNYRKLVQGKWPEGYKSAISAFRLKIHKFVYAGEHALKHIIRKEKSRTQLVFREKNLETVPVSISSCEKLQTIDFSYNKLRTLPKEIADLKSLRELNLSHNQFSIFPKELELLKDQLHKLYLTGNAFELSNYQATSNREVRKIIEEGLKSDIQTIRKLISKGDLEKAVDILFEVAKEYKDIANRVVVQSDQIHLLFAAKEGGTDSSENILTRRNNIIEHLLAIVNDLEDYRRT